MIVRICSAFVLSSLIEPYLDGLRGTVMPIYAAATGLLSVSVLQRHLVAYSEVLIVSSWESEEAMRQFMRHPVHLDGTLQEQTSIRREPIFYEVVDGWSSSR
jgi:heme-degrading monooxygenase HmoA